MSDSTEITELERRLDAAIRPIWEEGKTGYAWSPVDSLLVRELSLEGGVRTKKASSSGRLANVIIESNDRLESFYLILLAPAVTVDQAVRRVRKDISRFPNIKTIAVADRTSGMWRVRALVQERGAHDDAAAVWPLLPAVPRIIYADPVAPEDVESEWTGFWYFELPEGEPVPRSINLAIHDASSRNVAPGDTVVLAADSPDGLQAIGVGRVSCLRLTPAYGTLAELDPLLRFESAPIDLARIIKELEG